MMSCHFFLSPLLDYFTGRHVAKQKDSTKEPGSVAPEIKANELRYRSSRMTGLLSHISSEASWGLGSERR